jgi:hypothetical protein
MNGNIHFSLEESCFAAKNVKLEKIILLEINLNFE